MWNVIIDAAVESHDPANRTDREVGPGQETPDAELARVWMTFLQMIDLDHHRKPHLPRRLRARFVVDEPRHMFLLAAGHPQIHRGP
jgi:hypothetical protein